MMTQLRLYFLGTPRIEIDSDEVRLPRRKGLALLAYLAVTGVAQRRDTLATLFWPDSDQSKARGALRRELSSLRGALPGAWLLADDEHIALDIQAGIWLDVAEYGSLLASPAEGNAEVERLAAAVELYRGDFLAGFSLNDCPEFDDWQFFEGDSYRQALLTCLDKLVATYRQQGNAERALGYARRRLAVDILFEPAHRTLMELYALVGQQSAALRQYEECVRIFDEEFGVPPEEATTTLYEAIRARRFPDKTAVVSAPATETLQNPPTASSEPATPIHNLPTQSTPFIGRVEEVQAIAALLRDADRRLITITGPGGIGKTRLGLAVAKARLADFVDGVWFVPLSNVALADAVPRTIAAMLSIKIEGADVRPLLYAYLQKRRALLLLDNFEHLLDAADFLAELLHQAPQVKLLVTSQERLNLFEESLFPLRGLTVPQMGEATVSASTALALFDEAARRVKPDFSLADERAAVIAICQAVDGMPLGIELAASWVRAISCAEIATEITRSADFLRTTLRNLPERHRSIRAVFERSWSLLSAEEARMLRQISVFRGGFDRAAAVAVARTTPPMLVALIDRSLLRQQPAGRFDMHGLLHQFATEKLAQEPNLETAARTRHAAFYADLTARAGWELEPSDEASGRAAEEEAPNILAAWQWGVQHRDMEVVRQIMRWLVDYFRRHCNLKGGQIAFADAVQIFRDKPLEPHMRGLLGSLLLRLTKCADQQWNGNINVLHEAVTLLRAADPPETLELAQALVALALNYASLGQNVEGSTYLTEADALFRATGNVLGIGATLRDRGQLEMGWGRFYHAERLLQESAQVLEGHHRQSHLQSTFLLGTTLMIRGHYRHGEALLRRTIPFFDADGETMLAAYAQRNLGELYIATGDFAAAERCFADAYARFEPAGLGFQVTGGLCLNPSALARIRGDADAEMLLIEALATARRISFQQRIPTHLHQLSRLRHDQGDYEGALDLLEEALAVATEIDFRYATALVLAQQGHTFAALHQREEARSAFAKALEIAQVEGIDRIVCDALTGVAALMAASGEIDEALSLLVFVQTHEASEWEIKQWAGRQLDVLYAQVSTERVTIAGNRGDALSLEEAIRIARASLDATQSSG